MRNVIQTILGAIFSPFAWLAVRLLPADMIESFVNWLGDAINRLEEDG